MVNRAKQHLLLFIVLLSLFFIHTARANQDPQFIWPVSCTLNQDCWLVHYVDVDRQEGSAQDYTCNQLTYDGHKGTDIAVRDFKRLAAGVDIFSAMGGKILRVRSDMNDQPYVEDNQAVLGKECGNGVLIDHGSGWQTQYCHMKQGSIKVKPGQQVMVGRKLGEMGVSGQSEFPHLHFSVRHNNQIIDPFVGQANLTKCGQEATHQLWLEPIEYQPTSLYASGFDAKVPVYEELLQEASSFDKMSVSSPVLTFWSLIYGAQKGDEIHLKIIDPDGQIYQETSKVQPKTRIRQFYYIGKRNRSEPLKPGVYKGFVTLKRQLPDGEIINRTSERQLTVQ